MLKLFPAPRRSLFAPLCVLAALTSSANTARAQAYSLPSGMRFDGGASLVVPALDQESAAVFSSSGDISFGGGVHFGVGYDFKHIGVTLSGALSQHSVGSQNGNTLNVGILGHYRIAPVGSSPWVPVLTLGYVREGLGNVSAAPADLPPDVREMYAPGDLRRRNVGISGNGFRVGIGAERNMVGAIAMFVGANADVVDFSVLTYDGADISRDQLGNSVLFRLEAALRWRPRKPEFGH